MSLVRKFKGSSVSWQLLNLPHLEGDSEPPWLRNRSRSSLLVYVITGDGSLLTSPEKKKLLVAVSSRALIQVPSVLIWTKLLQNGGFWGNIIEPFHTETSIPALYIHSQLLRILVKKNFHRSLHQRMFGSCLILDKSLQQGGFWVI